MGSNVDALIAAGIRPPQVEDPSAVAMRAMQMRDMQQRAAYQGQLAQLANMRMQGIEREQADDQTVQNVLGQTGGDLGQALPMLAGKVGGGTYNDLQTKYLAQHKAKLDNTKDENAIADTYHEAMGSIANGIDRGGNTLQSFDAGTNLAIALHPEMKKLLDPYVAQAHADPSTIPGMTAQWRSETTQGRLGYAEDRAQAQEDRAEGLYPSQLSAARSAATSAQQKVEGTEPMTQYQIREQAIQQNRDLETQWYHRALIDIDRQRLNQGGEGDDGETPNSRATTRRLQMKQLDSLIDQEADLHRLRLQLGNAIGTGAIYVDQKGESGPLSTDENVKQAQLQEMRGRFQEATDEVNEVISRKNALGQQLGIQPRVSTEAAQSAVNRGARPQGQPQAQPQQGGQAGPKTLDRATAARILQEAGGNKARARALAQQRGYQF